MVATGIATLALAVGGCSNGSTPPVELIETYADVIVARTSSVDSAQVHSAIDSVLAAHGYDSLEFFDELRSMSATPELFKDFYDSVSVKLRQRRDSASTTPAK